MKINFVKDKIIKSNKYIKEIGLVFDSFGNTSIRHNDLCLIKPSGINLEKFKRNDVSVVEIKSNKLLYGKKPSVDLPLHLELYKKYPEINSIVHTHSMYATSWAQSLKPIPCLGTTHADYFNQDIPITKIVSGKKIVNYEKESGLSITKILKKNPLKYPGILLSKHGVVSWGSSIEEAIKNAEAIEYIAKLAFNTIFINKKITKLKKKIHKLHYNRKHGPKSYYGQ
jgi:L-ribulose-5-phosphate 4-epimerase